MPFRSIKPPRPVGNWTVPTKRVPVEPDKPKVKAKAKPKAKKSSSKSTGTKSKSKAVKKTKGSTINIHFAL